MLREIATRAAEAYARAETDLLRRKVEALGTRLARLEAPAG
jgi:ubiquinone biosynthesis protein UbiJ